METPQQTKRKARTVPPAADQREEEGRAEMSKPNPFKDLFTPQERKQINKQGLDLQQILKDHAEDSAAARAAVLERLRLTKPGGPQ
jgi:hypothetical protein